jgi:fumarate hydratase subunit alpha
MRIINTNIIKECVKDLLLKANISIDEKYIQYMKKTIEAETNQTAKKILDILIENNDYALQKQVPLCQDTGMAVIMLKIGQQVCLQGAYLHDAVNEGVKEAYEEGYLRKSVVGCPLRRENTKTNTPAVIYTEITNGQEVTITVMPKGFGSENSGGVGMLTPASGEEGVIDFVYNIVLKAGSNPCPPIVVGVGIGGTMDKAALISKQALLRPPFTPNQDPYIASLEQKLFKKINKSNIGPAGLGGKTTALAVYVETYPTHIAGLPVAVSISCHAIRHLERTI